MNNVDSKKELENNLVNVLDKMYIKELINEEFINLYFKEYKINSSLKSLVNKDRTLLTITDNEKKEINEILNLEKNNSLIKNFDTLIETARNFIVVKKMKNMNLL